MAWLSPLYSRRGIDLGARVRPLPEGGRVPHLAGWRWVHTPGHAPGHAAFFRESDRVLVAGDAFVTTKQESFFAALLKPQGIHGPPAYFTIDWPQARESVRRLAALSPEVAATGHGVPMYGPEMRRQLKRLADEFDRLALPADGRYVREPAHADAGGVRTIPPAVFPPAAVLLALGAGAAVGALSARAASPRARHA
jgi:glyoxylase-like metal-dependent hydrolase (beta-lactamase superfamily II)